MKGIANMRVKELLEKLELGQSVAEFDAKLDKYFVDTEAFRQLTVGNVDIIAGDKGTGKTALYRTLVARASGLQELNKTEIITGFNTTGSPAFQRLTQLPPLSENQYIVLWKCYLISLIGNRILRIHEGALTSEMKKLDQFLRRSQLRLTEELPETVFSKLVSTLNRLFHPSSATIALGVSDSGTPTLAPRVEWGAEPEQAEADYPDAEAGLNLVNQSLIGISLTVWVALDRLDEAFPGSPTIEVPALRALLRTYLDVQAYPSFRLKLFLRKDLFRRIIKGGFVNLTHVNARKFEIVWDEEDLKSLLNARIRESGDFVNLVQLSNLTQDETFYRIFPRKSFHELISPQPGIG